MYLYKHWDALKCDIYSLNKVYTTQYPCVHIVDTCVGTNRLSYCAAVGCYQILNANHNTVSVTVMCCTAVLVTHGLSSYSAPAVMPNKYFIIM